jgi:hypothetical protein
MICVSYWQSKIISYFRLEPLNVFCFHFWADVVVKQDNVILAKLAAYFNGYQCATMTAAVSDYVPCHVVHNLTSFGGNHLQALSLTSTIAVLYLITRSIGLQS